MAEVLDLMNRQQHLCAQERKGNERRGPMNETTGDHRDSGAGDVVELATNMRADGSGSNFALQRSASYDERLRLASPPGATFSASVARDGPGCVWEPSLVGRTGTRDWPPGPTPDPSAGFEPGRVCWRRSRRADRATGQHAIGFMRPTAPARGSGTSSGRRGSKPRSRCSPEYPLGS